MGDRGHTEKGKVARKGWEGVFGEKHRLGPSQPHSSAHWLHPTGLSQRWQCSASYPAPPPEPSLTTGQPPLAPQASGSGIARG